MNFFSFNNNKLKKSGLADSEPGSPKVSCWGNVLSEREKEKLREQRAARNELQNAPSCYSRFSVMMTCAGDRAAGRRGDSHFQLAEVNPLNVEDIHQSSEENTVSEVSAVTPRLSVEVEAVGLGELK
jgi:hypothetical protein